MTSTTTQIAGPTLAAWLLAMHMALGERVAQRRAYEIAEQIQFAERQMRRDIGHRAIGSKRSLL
jgi:phosphoribosylamine-glycine ligase